MTHQPNKKKIKSFQKTIDKLKKICYTMYVIKVKGNPLKKGIDTMKKLTKREMFAKILTHLTDEEEINFINHQIELLDNKANGVKKPTKTQIENEELKIVILDFLKTVDSASIVDIQKGANLEDVSNQKMSAILKQMFDSGLVNKIYEKRKPYFSVVGD